MIEYDEIDDIHEIARQYDALTSRLMSMSLSHEQRLINSLAVREPIMMYSLGAGLLCGFRTYGTGSVATQSNVLFAYDRRGPVDTDVEINFPLGNFRRTIQGAFVRKRQTGSIGVAHRGHVRRGRSGLWVNDAVDGMGATLIRVPPNPRPLILIGTIDALQPRDITEFVDNVLRAKALLAG